MCAVTAHSALLGRLTEIHSDKVVKVAYAHIIAPNEVLDIQIENADKKVGILLVRHIHFALGAVTERTQTWDKLQISEAFFSEIFVYTLGIFCTVACQHGKDIKFRTVFFHRVSRMENFEIRVFTLCVNPKTVALKISVKAETDKKFIPCEKFCPLIVDQSSVGLQTVKNPGIFSVKFFDRFGEAFKIRPACKQRLAALKGKGNAVAVGKIKRRSDELFRRVTVHYAEAEILTSRRNIAVKAVFAPEIAQA